MRTIVKVSFAALCLLVSTLRAPAFAADAEVGKAAPEFTLPGSDGKTHSLSSYRGKIVVLEWVNYECPFVKKHYHDSQRNMQKLQDMAHGKGIVWLSVSSSAEGKQGHLSAADAKTMATERGAHPAVTLLDHDGAVGKSYGAKTTPHMYIIDASGILRYQGAIDDTPSTEPADIPTAKNYVRQALDELATGKNVSEPATESYGCSVKYAF